MSDLMTLEPREADLVVREPGVNFIRAADDDKLHGMRCPCNDAWTYVATWFSASDSLG